MKFMKPRQPEDTTSRANALKLMTGLLAGSPCLDLNIAGGAKNLGSLSHSKAARYGLQRGAKFPAWANRILIVLPYG